MIEPSKYANQLLASFDAAILARLIPHLEWVELERGHVMVVSDTAFSHLYFPESGVGSVVGTVDGRQVELGLFGAEGMSGTAFAYGLDRSPYKAYMQIPGGAWRIRTRDLRSMIDDNPTANRPLLCYAYSFGVQVAETALSNGLFNLEQRLSRWLLMCHDRSPGDRIAITHGLLAIMLGVRRPAVTLAIQALEGAGILRASRALIVIRNRDLLMAAAGGCYGIAASEHRRLFKGVPIGSHDVDLLPWHDSPGDGLRGCI